VLRTNIVYNTERVALTGKKRTLGKSLGVTAVRVILGIITQTDPDRVELDVCSVLEHESKSRSRVVEW
jgi:hypothetical protein